MADNKKKRGGADRALIALGESYEVAYWPKKFKITAAKLKATVKKVGHSARKVEAYLKEQKHKAADRALIALSQPYEVRYWSKKFKITPARLKAAVAAAGHSSKNVAAYLARKKTTRKTAKKKTAGRPQRKRPPERRPTAQMNFIKLAFCRASPPRARGPSSTRATALRRWRQGPVLRRDHLLRVLLLACWPRTLP